MRMFTRGRLVPRQPRAIKRTTRTELHRCDIRNGKYIYRNNGAISTALHHEGIHIAKYIHWNTDIKHTTLYRYNIYNSRHIHWNIGIIFTALVINKQFIGLY